MARFIITKPVDGGTDFWEIHDSEETRLPNAEFMTISNRFSGAEAFCERAVAGLESGLYELKKLGE